jgi:hypothetical protein
VVPRRSRATYLGSFGSFGTTESRWDTSDQLSDEIVLMEGRQLGTGRLSGVDIGETLYIVFRFASGRLIEMHWHPRREGAFAAAGLPGEPH